MVRSIFTAPKYHRARQGSGVRRAEDPPHVSRNATLERRAETQLEHSRLVSGVVAERRQAIARTVFVLGIAPVVRVIEQIEYLEHAEQLYTITDRDPLL